MLCRHYTRHIGLYQKPYIHHLNHTYIITENLKDAIETGCEKCTEKQKEGSYEMIEHLIEKEPEIWNELCAKFDPTGKWRKEYEEKAKAKGIKIPS